MFIEMKGVLYHYFLESRAYLIGSVICFAASAALGVFCLNFFAEDPQNLSVLRSMIFPFLGLIIVVIACEGGARYIEKLQKTHFLNHVLSSRVSKGGFTLSLLAINLLSHVFGTALMFLLFAVLGLADGGFLSPELFLQMGFLMLFVGAVDLTLYYPTMLLKSAEKGGLVIGLIVGFGIVLPCMLLEDQEILTGVENLSSDPIAWLVCAGIYAVFCLLIWLRVKRGDVC